MAQLCKNEAHVSYPIRAILLEEKDSGSNVDQHHTNYQQPGLWTFTGSIVESCTRHDLINYSILSFPFISLTISHLHIASSLEPLTCAITITSFSETEEGPPTETSF